MKAVIADAVASARDLQKLWISYLALGVFLIACGASVIYSGTAGTIAAVITLGAVLCVAGIAQIVSGFMTRNAGHVILLLIAGVLDIIVGVMIAQHPNAGALVLTLLVAALLVFGGIFRFVAALWLQFPQYGWVALGAAVTAVLGVLLWYHWPISASWFLGFAVGASLIAAGAAWCSFAVNLKNA